jgi:ABC-type branched-subunit amino acid transport system substrate-binding protein
VIGLPEWEKFGNIESGYLLTLNAHVFQSSFTDFNSDNVKGFIQSYRSKYMDEPVDYALTGFDAGFFFLSALLNYGNDFERCIDEQRIQLIQNQYHFKRIEDGGYDNVYWNILQYEDYRLVNRSVSWK